MSPVIQLQILRWKQTRCDHRLSFRSIPTQTNSINNEPTHHTLLNRLYMAIAYRYFSKKICLLIVTNEHAKYKHALVKRSLYIDVCVHDTVSHNQLSF